MFDMYRLSVVRLKKGRCIDRRRGVSEFLPLPGPKAILWSTAESPNTVVPLCFNLIFVTLRFLNVRFSICGVDSVGSVGLPDFKFIQLFNDIFSFLYFVSFLIF